MDRRARREITQAGTAGRVQRNYRASVACAVAIGLLMAGGCAQQMAAQPSYRPLEGSRFFANGTSARKPVRGTVARGHLDEDVAFYEGMSQLVAPDIRLANLVGPTHRAPVEPTLKQMALIPYVKAFPLPVTVELLDRGEERFMIYCSVCHGADGTGDGIVVQRGFTRPPTYHSDRLRQAPPGYFFDLITHGLGSMPSYAQQIKPRDRWAIVAYLRALQLSQHADLKSLPQQERDTIKQALENHNDQAQ